MLKVLYVAYRHDPVNPDLASGVDYNFYTVMKQNDMEVKVLGPFPGEAIVFERVLRKLYRSYTGKKYAKFPLSLAWQVSKALNRMEKEWKPDVIFTLFPPALVFYTGYTPCVFGLDTTFLGQEEDWPLYGKQALNLSVWEENRAFARCAKIITHSNWSKNILVNVYQVQADYIEVFPMPMALPEQVVPEKFEVNGSKQLEIPLRLLLVGRVYKRKGIDIAVEITRQLNAYGLPTKLTVCGTAGTDSSQVKFVGPYKKSDSNQLQQYVELYQRAHFLLHPARFEAAGIVPGEAAAFGTPTITNNTGGLGTTVKDGESGVVLPKASPPEAYVKEILGFLRNPERYYDLCQKTRQRYERELNWDVAGKKVVTILKEVVQEK